MQSNRIQPVVDALVKAHRSREAQPSGGLAQALISVDDGYAAQAAVAAALGSFAGKPPLYWKSGGPSRDAELMHAPLPPAGVWPSPARASDWPFHMRGIEAEIALRMGRDVSQQEAESIDLEGARALVDAVAVSIEVVDSRWQEGLDAPALCKVADLLCHGALVLGEWVPFASVDWSEQVCRVRMGSQPAQEFKGTHSLADPAFVLAAWLRHATRHGDVVPAGAVVTTGSWCGLMHAQVGDLVAVEFPGIGSASLQF